MTSQPLPISVFIIAKNEQDRIARAIDSVKGWVEEILVIDSGSTDDTVSLAESHGARVLFNEWQGYGPQKVFGEGECANDWILNIDADEEIGPELRQRIETLFAKGAPEEAAFKMHWKMVLFDEPKPKAMAPGSTFVRLYNRRKAGFRDSTVHDSVVVREGSVGEIKELVFHRSFRSLRHMIEKLDSYSAMQAKDMHARGRNPGAIRLPFEWTLTFLKNYLLRRYWIYGADGLRISVIYANYRLARLTRARAMFARQENN